MWRLSTCPLNDSFQICFVLQHVPHFPKAEEPGTVFDDVSLSRGPKVLKLLACLDDVTGAAQGKIKQWSVNCAADDDQTAQLHTVCSLVAVSFLI